MNKINYIKKIMWIVVVLVSFQSQRVFAENITKIVTRDLVTAAQDVQGYMEMYQSGELNSSQYQDLLNGTRDLLDMISLKCMGLKKTRMLNMSRDCSKDMAAAKETLKNMSQRGALDTRAANFVITYAHGVER